MQTQNPSFASSWRMLTRDKGWIKPLLVLTLVGWIPILGQIAVLGYALEWARLTAWGVEAAPKQHGVDYGKVLSSGGRAFCVSLTLGIVIALVLEIMLPGSFGLFMNSVSGSGLFDGVMSVSLGGITIIAIWVLMLLSETFIDAAALRATLYDSFSAGWRLDRLFEMVRRDFKGFLKTVLVAIIGAVISSIYTAIVGFIMGIFIAGGVLGTLGFMGMSGSIGEEEMIIRNLLSWGAAPALLLVLIAILLAFIGGVIGTAMNLVSINAVGQWFARFDVNRWGTSAAPLPADVPHKDVGWEGAAPVGPTPAVGSAPTPSTPVDDVPPTPASVPTPMPPIVEEPGAPESAPVNSEPAARELADEPVPTVSEPAPAVIPATVEPAITLEPVAESAESAESASVAEPVAESEASKEPIPLGPITSDDGPAEEDGPIA